MKKRLRSFVYAFHGIKELTAHTPNARIHLSIAFLVIVLGFVFRVSASEWIAIAICIGMVLGMEAINSALENISDFVCKETNIHIKKIKDLAAGGVLLVAMASFVVGCIIFIPKILSCLGCPLN